MTVGSGMTPDALRALLDDARRRRDDMLIGLGRDALEDLDGRFSGLIDKIPAIALNLIGVSRDGNPTLHLNDYWGWPDEFAGLDPTAAVELACAPLAEGCATSGPTGLAPLPKRKGGHRFICAPNIPDRLLQRAIYELVGVLYWPLLPPSCHGFVPGKGVLDAVWAVFTRLSRGQYGRVATVDIKRCYALIPVEPVMALFGARIADERLLAAIRDAITARPHPARIRQVRRELQGRGALSPEDDRYLRGLGQRDIGLSEGCSMSPLGTLLYLTPLMAALEDTDGISYVQYADDGVVLIESDSDKALRQALDRAGKELGLEIAVDVVEWRQPAYFEFLGRQVWHGHGDDVLVMPDDDAMRQIRDRMNAIANEYRRAPDSDGNGARESLLGEAVDLFRPYPLTAPIISGGMVARAFGITEPAAQRVQDGIHGLQNQVIANAAAREAAIQSAPPAAWERGRLDTLLGAHPHHRQTRTPHRSSTGRSGRGSRGSRSQAGGTRAGSTPDSSPGPQDEGRAPAGRTARSARGAAAARAPRVRRRRSATRPGGPDEPKRRRRRR